MPGINCLFSFVFNSVSFTSEILSNPVWNTKCKVIHGHQFITPKIIFSTDDCKKNKVSVSFPVELMFQ